MAWDGAWPHQSITKLTRSLNNLEQTVNNDVHNRNDDVNGALARFLVVRSCGYLEQVVDEACKAYLKSKSSPRCYSFGSSSFGKGRNPRPEKLIELVTKFDAAWASELKLFLEESDEERSRELSYLVDRRNKISHGLNEGVGLVKALKLKKISEQVADWFIVKFDPR